LYEPTVDPITKFFSFLHGILGIWTIPFIIFVVLFLIYKLVTSKEFILVAVVVGVSVVAYKVTKKVLDMFFPENRE